MAEKRRRCKNAGGGQNADGDKILGIEETAHKEEGAESGEIANKLRKLGRRKKLTRKKMQMVEKTGPGLIISRAPS